MRRTERGRRAHRAGHVNEIAAALLLLFKGYRIIGFRLNTGGAEIDILAIRGLRLAMVEVKSRQSVEAALGATHPDQVRRLWQAGQSLQARRGALKACDLCLDLYVFVPGRWPQHIRNAFLDLI